MTRRRTSDGCSKLAVSVLASSLLDCGGTAVDPKSTIASETSSASGDTTWQPADAVCGEIEAAAAAKEGPTAYFWGCCFECGLFVDGPGDAWDVTVAASRDSYAMLDPTGECYALRTALYACLSTLTCVEVLAWHEATNDHAAATCIAEYDALAPRIDECGI